eukprot:6179041-Pleurochrysis_carterae.AAC.2
MRSNARERVHMHMRAQAERLGAAVLASGFKYLRVLVRMCINAQVCDKDKTRRKRVKAGRLSLKKTAKRLGANG